MTQLPANVRIIDLPVGVAPTGSEPIETVQNGISVQLSQAQIALSIAPALSVRGNPTNASAAVQDVVGTANQVLRVNAAGTSWSWGQVNLASSAAVTGVLVVVNGGTGFGTYTLGDTLYSDAANSLAKLAGNITTTRKFLRQTGNGAVSAAPVWDTILAADIPASALTKVDDTNVTLTLGGSPNTALLAAASITAGWTGTLAAARLNANVVQSVVNDTNVTGSIATQALTLGWTGTLAVTRGGTGGGSASATLLDNITGFAATGILVRTGAGTYAFRTLTAPAAGITVSNGDGVAGNPTLVLANDLAALEGLGGTGIARRTGTDTWSVGTTVTVAEGGTGQVTLTDHGVVIGRGTAGVDVTSAGTTGQVLKSGGSGANGAYADDLVSITFIIDGGGATITTGVKGDLEIPFSCTITVATLLADQSGSIVVNVWKDTFANFPPTVADKITASAPPTITTATNSKDSTLTGWTTSITAGDTLRFNVDSITTIQRVTLSLKVKRL